MINIDIRKKPNELSALTLAYIGDAIYELYIRKYVVSLGGKPNVLHRKAITYVSAKAQANIIHHLKPLLTEEELEIVKRGRNAKPYTVPKNANVIDYKYSTAFETLLGHLYLSNETERLERIVELAIKYIEEKDGE